MLPVAVAVNATQPGFNDGVDWTANATAPGFHYPGHLNTPGTIPAGTCVDCYLLHCDPANNNYYYGGTLSFASPILGVIRAGWDPDAGGDRLDPSDQPCGFPGTSYSNDEMRGFDPWAGGSWASGLGDNFTLSPDMHAIYFSNGVGDSIDELRILTAPQSNLSQGYPSSYGINGAVSSFSYDDTRQILLLDYNVLVADFVPSSGPAADPSATGSGNWTLEVAARHPGNTANVLYGDGHVETATLDGIDPRIQNNYDWLWSPSADTLFRDFFD